MLDTCSSCSGFVPSSATRCPNCDASFTARRAAKRLLQIAGGGAIAMTLMACYGGAPQPPKPTGPTPTAMPKAADAAKAADGAAADATATPAETAKPAETAAPSDTAAPADTAKP